MDEGNILNDVLSRFLEFIDRGFGLISGEVYWLFGALLVLNLVLAGLTWASSEDQVMVSLSRRILYIGFFAYLVLNWPTLVDVLGESFVRLGAKAGDQSSVHRDFYNPGMVMAQGWHGAWEILEEAGDLSGLRATFVNFPQILVLICAAFVYFGAMALLAFQVFLALLQFKVGALASFILLPMALLNKTTFLAERPIGWMFTSGVRLMVLSLVMTLGLDLVDGLSRAQELTLRQAVAAAVGATSLFLLGRMATSMAGDLVSGSPSLGVDGAPSAIRGAKTAGGVAFASAAPAGRAVSGAVGTGARYAAVRAASMVPVVGSMIKR